MRRILEIIDSISEYTGRAAKWICVALVIVLTYEVMMRYVFNAPTIWAHLTSMMLSGAIVMMGLAYTHLHHGHIRVDIFYTRLSPRGKAVTDVICALLFLFPLLAIFLRTSASWMWRSWIEGEVRIESYWYPLAGPFRTVMFLGVCLFALQAVAQFIRDLYFLVRNKPYD